MHNDLIQFCMQKTKEFRLDQDADIEHENSLHPTSKLSANCYSYLPNASNMKTELKVNYKDIYVTINLSSQFVCIKHTSM